MWYNVFAGPVFKSGATPWWTPKALFDVAAPSTLRWVSAGAPVSPPASPPLPRQGQRGQDPAGWAVAWLEPLPLWLTPVEICMTKPAAGAPFGDHVHQEPDEFHQKLRRFSGPGSYSSRHWPTKPITSSAWKRNSLQLLVRRAGFCFFILGQFSPDC